MGDAARYAGVLKEVQLDFSAGPEKIASSPPTVQQTSRRIVAATSESGDELPHSKMRSRRARGFVSPGQQNAAQRIAQLNALGGAIAFEHVEGEL